MTIYYVCSNITSPLRSICSKLLAMCVAKVQLRTPMRTCAQLPRWLLASFSAKVGKGKVNKTGVGGSCAGVDTAEPAKMCYKVSASRMPEALLSWRIRRALGCFSSPKMVVQRQNMIEHIEHIESRFST